MKKIFSVIFLLILLIGIAPVWGGGEKEAAKPEAPKEPVQIEFLVWYAQDKDFNDYIDQYFESKHPNIKVNFVKMGAWDLHDKLIVSLTAGTGAGDVVSMVKRRFRKYSSTGRLVDLTPYVKDLKPNFPESLWDVGVYQGKVYGIALDESPALFFYRKDLFEKAGYQTIKTWPQFVEAGKKLKQNGTFATFRQYPAVTEALEDSFIYLNSMGGNYFTEDGKIVDPNPKLKEMLQLFYDMQFKDKITKLAKYYSQEFWAAYKDDSIASLPGATWISGFIKRTIPEQSGKWAISPWPKWSDSSPDVTGQWGGTCVAVPGYSKHKEEAIELIKWMAATTEGQLMFTKFNGMYPSYLPAHKDAYFSQGDPYFGGQNMFSMIQPIPNYYQYDWAEMAPIVGKQLDLLWEEKQNVDATYQNIIKNMKSELGR